MTTEQSLSGRRVSILGCGWLGMPLARLLSNKGAHVKGSTTQQDKLAEITANQCEPFRIDFRPEPQGEGLKEFFDCDILILTIPFKRSFIDPKEYFDQIASVSKVAANSRIDFLIFSSSTSVYPSSSGLVSEEDDLVPDTERAKVLCETEQMLLSKKEFDATVIRFGGLYGPERNIGKLMKRKKDVPDGPVNLIHLEDCLELMFQIIFQDKRGQVINAVSDMHPLRSELYAKKAIEANVDPPTFVKEGGVNKIVSNEKARSLLNFTFRHPDPMKDIL